MILQHLYDEGMKNLRQQLVIAREAMKPWTPPTAPREGYPIKVRVPKRFQKAGV